jgi:uncharacterized protein
VERLVLALSRLVRRSPARVVVGALVLTVLFLLLSTQVEMSTGNEGFAPDNPEIQASETLTERFGDSSEEVVQVLFEAPEGDVVSADGFQAVGAVAEAIAQSDTGRYLSERPDRPAIVSFMAPAQQELGGGQAEGNPNDAQVDAAFSLGIQNLPQDQASLVEGMVPDGTDLASASSDAGLMLIFLETGELPGTSDEQFDELIAIESDLADAVRSVDLPGGIRAEPFSFPLLFADEDEFASEVGRLFGLAFLIILVILGFVYWLRPEAGYRRRQAGRRTVADVALTLLTIVMAITWMNGAAVLLGPGYLNVIGGLTELTQIIPVLLIGLGVDYAIHLTSRYREEVGGGVNVAEGIERAVRTVGIALVLATVTTSVGFLTNVVNPIPALKDFGIVAAVGIVASFLLMLSFIPAVRLLLDRRAERLERLPRSTFEQTGERFLPGLMARTAVLAEHAALPTLLVTVLIGGGLGIYGLTELDTKFSSTDFVPQDSPLIETFDALVDRFGGGLGESTQVLLSGDVDTAEGHNAIVAAQGNMAELDDVINLGESAAVTSPISLLGQLIAPGGGDQPSNPEVAAAAEAAGVREDLTVPEGADVAALYQVMLEAAPEETASVLATDSSGEVELARMDIQTRAGEARAGALANDLAEALEPAGPAGVTAVATSNNIITEVIISELQDSQVQSLAITLLAAMLLLVVTFWVESRRPLLGVITIAPVALVVLWTFGLMAATGIPFGPVTATISALAIGIGVPYTIHITHRYQEDRLRHGEDLDAAMRSTVRHTGGALAGSAFTTMAGFGVLITSSLVPFRQFGQVTVYAIGFALLAATIVLPSLLVFWDRWNVRRGRPVVATVGE